MKTVQVYNVRNKYTLGEIKCNKPVSQRSSLYLGIKLFNVAKWAPSDKYLQNV